MATMQAFWLNTSNIGNKKKTFILDFSFNWKFFQKILLQKETILQLKFILVIIEAFF